MKWLRHPPEWLLFVLPLLILVWLPLSPRSQASQKALHLAYLARQDAVAARQIEIAAQQQPWRADLWEKAGSIALSASNFDRAVKDLTQAQLRGSLSREGWQALGDAYLGLEDPARAREIYTRLVAASEDPALYQRLIDILLEEGDYPAAIDLFERRMALEPDRADLLYQAGLVATLENPDRGLAWLIRASELDGAYTSRVKILQTAINTAGLEEDPAFRNLSIGKGYGTIGEWRLAGAWFEEAIRLRPDFAEAWALLGESRQQLGLAGISQLQKARELNPQSTFVQVLYALYWKRSGKPDQAVTVLEQTVKQEPDNSNWWIELADAYAQVGKINEAMAGYQRAVLLSPDDSFSWRSLASFSILYNQDVSGAGIQAARKAVALDPGLAANLDIMAQVLIKTGDFSTAERFLQRALEEEPDNALVHLHYGILLLQKGSSPTARAYLETAAALDGDGPIARQANRLLEAYGKGP